MSRTPTVSESQRPSGSTPSDASSDASREVVLAYDTVVHIMTFLPVQEFARAASVCKLWREASRDVYALRSTFTCFMDEPAIRRRVCPGLTRCVECMGGCVGR